MCFRMLFVCFFYLIFFVQGQDNSGLQTIYELATGSGFSTLASLINGDNEVAELLKRPGQLSFFAPMDDAFKKLPPNFLQQLSKDKQLLRSVLSAHIVYGILRYKDFGETNKTVTTANPTVNLTLSSDDDGVYANGVYVFLAELGASNGLVHVTEELIIPEKMLKKQNKNLIEVALDSNLNIFVNLLTKAGLNDLLRNNGPFTIFVPTNEVLRKLGSNAKNLRRILLAHIVPGEFDSNALSQQSQLMTGLVNYSIKISQPAASNKVKVNDASIVQADRRASNGVIHVIDKVINPCLKQCGQNGNRNNQHGNQHNQQGNQHTQHGNQHNQHGIQHTEYGDQQNQHENQHTQHGNQQTQHGNRLEHHVNREIKFLLHA